MKTYVGFCFDTTVERILYDTKAMNVLLILKYFNSFGNLGIR